ncbi:MAG: cytochrome-c peroxidase, partial [Gammaproteobacteria bacterium]|nr:cytochrome-c peroxidase [Gammaproteobacteria bacterium]NIR92528.1 cytochrome-c peroxidase [Gammaproteobacteria bacterium]
EQAIAEHLVSPTEMAMPDKAALVTRLSAIEGYKTQFEKVFDREGELSFANISRALSAYIRTLTTHGSDFDRYLQGDN